MATMETNTTKIIRSVNTSKHNFTPISNTLIQNKNLSLEARALIIYIVSLPENWVIWKQQVQSTLGMGRYQFDRIWKECVDAGYIKTKKFRAEGGKFTYHYEVTDNLSDVGLTTVGKTDGGLFDVGKPNTIIKKEEEKIQEEKKEIKNKDIKNTSIADQNNTITELFNSNPDLFTKEFLLNYITNKS